MASRAAFFGVLGVLVACSALLNVSGWGYVIVEPFLGRGQWVLAGAIGVALVVCALVVASEGFAFWGLDAITQSFNKTDWPRIIPAAILFVLGVGVCLYSGDQALHLALGVDVEAQERRLDEIERTLPDAERREAVVAGIDGDDLNERSQLALNNIRRWRGADLYEELKVDGNPREATTNAYSKADDFYGSLVESLTSERSEIEAKIEADKELERVLWLLLIIAEIGKAFGRPAFKRAFDEARQPATVADPSPVIAPVAKPGPWEQWDASYAYSWDEYLKRGEPTPAVPDGMRFRAEGPVYRSDGSLLRRGRVFITPERGKARPDPARPQLRVVG